MSTLNAVFGYLNQGAPQVTTALTESEWSEIHDCLSPVMYVRVRDAIAELTKERDEAIAKLKIGLSPGLTLIERLAVEVKRAEAAEAEVTRLREALKPFAAEANGAESFADASDRQALWVVYGNPGKQSFTVGDLRRAKASLSPSPSSIDLVVPQTQGENKQWVHGAFGGHFETPEKAGD